MAPANASVSTKLLITFPFFHPHQWHCINVDESEPELNKKIAMNKWNSAFFIYDRQKSLNI
jgi:hypothetical protein